MITLTYDEAVALLLRAVAEKGEDYVYPDSEREGGESYNMCQYAYDGRPSCIVGYVLAASGYDISTLSNKGIDSLIDSGKVKVEDEETESLLFRTQNMQDRRTPWGAAVREARFQSEWVKE
jgi:hypothetical protein